MQSRNQGNICPNCGIKITGKGLVSKQRRILFFSLNKPYCTNCGVALRSNFLSLLVGAAFVISGSLLFGLADVDWQRTLAIFIIVIGGVLAKILHKYVIVSET
ncbi:hypothetical protein [Chitinimonas prasina]|uniref:hypothetical protein n=1 Tax=Chitinimonas prasina TaxID=1434937 RepID=UPI0024E0B05F|nr:hypothetical protein [Chitinimonas prasina]